MGHGQEELCAEPWGMSHEPSTIHDRLINQSLKEIEDEDYESVIQKLIDRKAKEYKGNAFEKKQKVSRYMLQKGYSYNEIKPHLISQFQAKK